MGKSIVKNSIYNVLYKMLNVLFPLVSIVIVSRALLPGGIGKVSTAQNIVTYFTFVACLGLPNYGTREIAKNKTHSSKIFTELFVLNFISSIMCSVAYYTMIFVNDRYHSEYKLYVVSGLAVVLNIFNVDWLYQGKEEYKYIALRSLIVKLFMLLAIFLFVHSPSDYVKYSFIYCMAIAGNYLFNIYNLKRMGIGFVVKDINISKHLRAVFVLFASSIAVELYSLLDITMLSFMCSEEVVGYYSNAMKLVKVAISVITAISGVLLPRLSWYMKNGDKKKASNLVNNVYKIMFFLSLPCLLGMYILSDKIVVVLFGDAFVGAVSCVKILVFLFMAIPFSNLFGIQVLIASGKESKVFICTAIGAIVNIMLNLLLIKIWNQNGAAVASVVSEMIVMLVMYLFSKRVIDFQTEFRFIGKCIVSAIIMSIIVVVFKENLHNYYIILGSAIIVGAIVYLLANYILKNEVIMTARNWMRNRK